MDPLGECPAVEVFKFRDKDGYFGQVLTSITRYFGQVIAPSIKDSTATHIPFNRQRVAYHWNVMNFNGKRESFKGSVWWSAFPSSASVELKSRKSKRQCEQHFLCSEPRTQGRPPSSRSVSGWPSSQTQAVRPLTIHNRFTWKFTHGVTKFGYTFTFWQVGLQRSHHRLGWNRCLVKMPLTEKALTFSCGGGTLPLDKSCSYMVNGRRPQGGGEKRFIPWKIMPIAARAPASWLEEMHKGNPTWRGQPNYAVLVNQHKILGNPTRIKAAVFGFCPSGGVGLCNLDKIKKKRQFFSGCLP